ncbi:sugar ABC transporter permease [Spirochaetota bacterium]
MNKFYKQWFFVLVFPAFTLFAFVIIIPFCKGVLYSLTNWRGTYFVGNKSMWESFVGFKNFVKAFKSEKFLESLLYTFQVTFVTVPATTGMALLVAVFLNKLGKSKSVFRTIFYLPNMLGNLAMGFVWVFIFQVVFTDNLFGPDGLVHIEALRYMTQDKYKALFAIVIMSVWVKMGYMMLIFVGGLNTIPSELYEAASIEGASAWQRFKYITTPLLMPSVTIVLFLTLANSFKLLDRNVALTEGSFGTRMIALQIQKTITDTSPPDYGVAQAQAVIFFIIVAVITLVQVTVTRKKEVEY